MAAVETGGVLRDGADAWLLVRWDIDRFDPDVRDVFGKDGGILPYALVAANHSGRRGVLLGHTSIRVCCANTLGMAETEAAGGASRWRTVSALAAGPAMAATCSGARLQAGSDDGPANAAAAPQSFSAASRSANSLASEPA